MKEVTTKSLKEYQKESTKEAIFYLNAGIFSVAAVVGFWLDQEIAGACMLACLIFTLIRRNK